MRGVLACVVFLVLCLAPVSSFADAESADTQVADWVFKLPDSMRIVTGLKGQPVMAFVDTPDNFSTTVLFAGSTDLKGLDRKKAFKKWAEEGREELKKALGVADAGQVTETRTKAGYDMLGWAAGYTDRRDVTWVVILTCLRCQARAGALIYVTNDLDRLEKQAGIMDTLLNTATFSSCRGDEPAPKLKIHIDPKSTPSFLWEATELPQGDCGLEGIYGATGLGAAGDPREEITTAKYRWRYYTFFADGRVMRIVPPEGLLCFKFEYWQQRYPGDCGKYALKNDVVEMTFARADGSTWTEKLKRKGDELLDGDKPYRPLDGRAKLKGTFMRHDVESMGEYYKLGITFKEDSTFDDAGFNSRVNIGWWVGGDCELRDIEVIPGKGTWTVANNTLELLYEDGRRRRFAFHRYPGEPENNPAAIVLNGNVLTLVE
ncbi:MAG: hypothetical protein K8I27_04210 [Planctomycetes bacterium]|nr:hypothetical protein [Planctomycetota bacterium]